MDQVAIFANSHLKDMRRHPGDKALTKTVINDYAKNSLLPPLAKKKYSKDYMLMFVLIYYFKNLLSSSDIEELFCSIASKHFSGQTLRLSLEDIYNEVFTLEKDEMSNLKPDVVVRFVRAQDIFSDVPMNGEDRECLKLFAFICELSFNVYLKMQMVEMTTGQLKEDTPAPHKRQASQLVEARL